jgi:hypothetical protein
MIAEHATAAQVERTMRAYRGVLFPDDELAETDARRPNRLTNRFRGTARRSCGHEFDALAMMVDSFLEHGAATRNGGDRYQIVVNADAEVLSGDVDGTCELANGPALCPETVRRLA